MKAEEYTEFITDSEANFLIDLYEAIRERTFDGENVSLVWLGRRLNVNPLELADYLPIIVTMLDNIENEILKGKRRD